MKNYEMNFLVAFFALICLAPVAFAVDPTWVLFTRSNPTTGYIVNKTNVDASPFNATKRMIILIGGFNYNHTKIFPTKDQILADNDVMVIVVNWDHLGSDLIRTMWNIDKASKQLANFLKHLRNNKGYSENKMWFYGHSMGGHYAGMVGRKMNPTLTPKFNGTITGMDVPPPMWNAFFFFILLTGNTPPTALDITAARFVYGIHSSSGAQQASYGHTNVYMNGGLHQPKCARLPGIEELICSHGPAFDDYWATVNSSLQAVKCTSYQQAQSHQCIGPTTITFSKYFIEYERPGPHYLDYDDGKIIKCNNYFT